MRLQKIEETKLQKMSRLNIWDINDAFLLKKPRKQNQGLCRCRLIAIWQYCCGQTPLAEKNILIKSK